MKNTNDIAKRFSAWRKANRRASLGAVALVSLSASRSLADETGAARIVLSTVAEHSTNDTIADEETIGAVSRLADRDETAPAGLVGPYLLTRAERARLATEYTPRVKTVQSPSPVDPDLLPADFTPAPVAEYTPIIDRAILSPDELAAIDAESAAEIAEITRINDRDAAAVDFVSDYADPAPVDYAPGVPAIVRSVAPVAAPVSEAEALRLAVLALSR